MKDKLDIKKKKEWTKPMFLKLTLNKTLGGDFEHFPEDSDGIINTLPSP